MATADDRRVRCECKGRAERVWLSRGERRMLETPIVLHRYANGQWGVPAHAGAATPADAERIEIRSMADYNSTMKRMNAEERSLAEAKHERLQGARERLIADGRRELAASIARETDPLARDLMREALESNPTAHQDLNFREFFCEAMERNASNRDGGWDHRNGMSTRK